MILSFKLLNFPPSIYQKTENRYQMTEVRGQVIENGRLKSASGPWGHTPTLRREVGKFGGQMSDFIFPSINLINPIN